MFSAGLPRYLSLSCKPDSRSCKPHSLVTGIVKVERLPPGITPSMRSWSASSMDATCVRTFDILRARVAFGTAKRLPLVALGCCCWKHVYLKGYVTVVTLSQLACALQERAPMLCTWHNASRQPHVFLCQHQTADSCRLLHHPPHTPAPSSGAPLAPHWCFQP